MFSLAFFINTACKNNAGPSKEINIKIDSLSENGKSLIEQNLAKENGVISVKAHFRKRIITIVYDTTKESKDKLVGMLEKMGYKTELTGPVVKENN